MSAPAATTAAPGRDRPRAVPRAPRLLPPGALAAAPFLLLVIAGSVAPALFTGAQPNAVDPTDALHGPSLHHLFGTDELGRDVYSRTVYGTRVSVGLGVGATLLAVALGSLAGILAATAGRVVDEIIMRACDILLAFPGLLLALFVVAVLGPGPLHAALAIGVAMSPGFARLVRAQALVVRHSDYVRAAVTFGRRRPEIYLRHLAPNALAPLLVLATVTVGGAIVAGSSLSFLGLGPQPPSPDWGSMLAAGQNYLSVSWATAVFPGLAITATVVSVTSLGRHLRTRFEGRASDGD
jgi:peptide/nickel transport system permease protein